MLDFMTFLTTVLYLHDPIPGILRQTLLHLTLYIQKSVFKLCLHESNMISSYYWGQCWKTIDFAADLQLTLPPVVFQNLRVVKVLSMSYKTLYRYTYLGI